MFDRIGCFHFVEGHDRPICALKEQMGRCGDLTNSLIVLPEAFNLGRPYGKGPGPTICHSSIKTALTKLAKDCSITFVVSLLVPGEADKPDNVAYLIDGLADPREICKKKGDDGTGIYEPRASDCDLENPITVNGTSVGVLICMDARDRFKALRERLQGFDSVQKLICIPAAFSGGSTFLGGRLGWRFWPEADDTTIVLANSLDEDRSFVTNRLGVIIASADPINENQLVLLPAESRSLNKPSLSLTS